MAYLPTYLAFLEGVVLIIPLIRYRFPYDIAFILSERIALKFPWYSYAGNNYFSFIIFGKVFILLLKI